MFLVSIVFSQPQQQEGHEEAENEEEVEDGAMGGKVGNWKDVTRREAEKEGEWEIIFQRLFFNHIWFRKKSIMLFINCL